MMMIIMMYDSFMMLHGDSSFIHSFIHSFFDNNHHEGDVDDRPIVLGALG